MRIRYVGIKKTRTGNEHRDYPHRLELLTLQDELDRAGLPPLQQVAYGAAGSPELCLELSNVPTVGEEIALRSGLVNLAWHEWVGKHKALDAKLVFAGLEEALSECGYRVNSSIRAGSDGTRRLAGRPIAMMVKFATRPTQPEWSGILGPQEIFSGSDSLNSGHQRFHERLTERRQTQS
jgi:hypothetical protein